MSSTHLQPIKFILKSMNYPAETLLDSQLFHKGLSGALVYRLHFADDTAILKVTEASSGAIPFERAEREYRFYQDIAPLIPLSTPKMLAVSHDETRVALLLSAHQPSLPPAEWPEADFHEVTRQLARFHATFWGRVEKLSGFDWLKPRPEKSEADVQTALDNWQSLQEMERFADVLTETNIQHIGGIIGKIRSMKALNLLPLTFCHGDCFAGNILRDGENHFIWTDWQEARLGLGVEDVSFLLQRAHAAGAMIASEPIFATYHQTLETALGSCVSLADLHRMADIIELESRVLEWPAYLSQAVPSVLVAMLSAIFALSERLRIESA